MKFSESLLAQFKANKLPVNDASVLPAYCYTSPDWYGAEIDQVFMKEWICVGREEKVSKNGDYMTMQIGSEPLVIVRDHKGVVRAFLNVCRHRQSKIAQGSGNTRTLVCGYHCWTYTLQGDLIVVPGKPDPMIGANDFDRKRYGLMPVRIERWAGFLFVNFSETAPSLLEWLGGLPEFLRNYRLEETFIDHELTFDVNVNWKVFVENTMESYHAGFVHSKFLSPDIDQGWKFLETDGPFEAMYSDKSIMDFGNLPPIEGLTPKQEAGLFHIWLHPNTTIHVSSTYMTFRRYVPLGVDKMQIIYNWCFHPVTKQHPRFPEVVKSYYQKSEEILGEDVVYVPNVQQGLSSGRTRPGRYSPSEYIVHKIGNYVIDKVAGPQLSTDPQFNVAAE
jgi:choline monooxygenase